MGPKNQFGIDGLMGLNAKQKGLTISPAINNIQRNCLQISLLPAKLILPARFVSASCKTCYLVDILPIYGRNDKPCL